MKRWMNLAIGLLLAWTLVVGSPGILPQSSEARALQMGWGRDFLVGFMVELVTKVIEAMIRDREDIIEKFRSFREGSPPDVPEITSTVLDKIKMSRYQGMIFDIDPMELPIVSFKVDSSGSTVPDDQASQSDELQKFILKLFCDDKVVSRYLESVIGSIQETAYCASATE